MKKTTLISLIIVAIISYIILFGIGGVNQTYQSWFQFPKNYTLNDNYLNKANHDYGYNLMLSAEPNSIFMTEGGDNQVFSLLYFSTSERMRPDIDFFDQKGNIFPRLYGDLLNTYADELELIRSIRDFQLFSTERPIYLTWKRKDLNKLNISHIRSIKKKIYDAVNPQRKVYLDNKYKISNLEDLKKTARNMVAKSIYDLSLRSGGNLANQDFKYLGPWYFKNFGIVFRITPLRYAIVDALENYNGIADKPTIITEVEKISKIQMIPNQFAFYIKQLSKEGYLIPKGNSYKMLKPYMASFSHLKIEDYWKEYNFSYFNAPNAKYWDFLTREIFANYTRLHNSYAFKEISKFNKILSLNSTKEEKQNLLAKIKFLETSNQKFFNSIPIYNYDNPGMLFNYANKIYQQNPYKAVTYFIAIARSNYRYTDNYLKAINILLNYAIQESQNKSKYIKEARNYLIEFYQQRNVFLTMTLQSHKWANDIQVKQAEGFESKIEGIEKVSQTDIDKIKKGVTNNLQKLKALANLYKQRSDIPNTISTLKKIIALQPKKYQNYQNLYDFVKTKNFRLSIDALNDILEKYNSLEGEKPEAWTLNFDLGRLYFAISEFNISQNNFATVKNDFNNSKAKFKEFINAGKSKKNPNNTLLQKISISEKSIIQINKLLEKY